MSYIPNNIGNINSQNSSFVTLGSNGVFTGTSTDVSTFSSITVSVISDVASASNGLSIQFSMDGTNWDIIKTYDVLANSSQNHVTPVQSKYFRVVYTNGVNAQTSFRLQTLLHSSNKTKISTLNDTIDYKTTDCIVTNSVLNATVLSTNTIDRIGSDGSGNLNVRIKAPTSAFGDIRVIEPFPTAQSDFSYGLNSNLFTITGSLGGTAIATGGLAVVTCGAAATSFATLTSKRRLKYRAGQGGLVRFTIVFTAGVAGNIQIAGVGTNSDGYFFGYNGTSYGILYRSSASGTLVDTWIPQTSWNVDKMDGTTRSGVTIDPTKGNVYQIAYTYLGYGNVTFSIFSSEFGDFIPVHILKYPNTTTVQLVRNPTLPITFTSQNTTNTTAISLKTASIAQFNDGIQRFLGPSYAFDNTSTTTAAGVTSIILRNATTFGGIDNQSYIRLRSVSIGSISTASAVTTLQIYLNPTFGATPTYTNIDVNNSITSTSTTATTVTGGVLIFNMVCGSAASNLIDLTDFLIFAGPGDILAFAVKSPSNTTIGLAANWTEDI